MAEKLLALRYIYVFSLYIYSFYSLLYDQKPSPCIDLNITILPVKTI
jgi:hypothetical protein